MDPAAPPSTDTRRGRAPLVALVLAGAALVLALVAVIVVLTRSSPPPAAPSEPPAATLVESQITTATLLATLVETPFIDTADRVEPGDPATLGLAPGDVVLSVGGRRPRTASAARAALLASVRDGSPTLLFEVERAGTPTVVRVAIDGDLAQLRVDLQAALAARRPTATATATAGLPTDVLDAGIERLDDTHATITRALYDQIVADPRRVTTSLRIIPWLVQGRTEGVRIYGMRRATIWAKLGFANGDTIHTVNGYKVGVASGQLDAWTRNRGATHFEVEMTRRGQPITLTIDVI